MKRLTLTMVSRGCSAASRCARRPTTISPFGRYDTTLGTSDSRSQSAMATGRSLLTYATSELVVPRSMPMGRGAALGSKISKRAMILRRQLVLDGAHLVEEAPEEPELTHLRHELGRLASREPGRQLGLDSARALLDGLRHGVDAGEILRLLGLVERLALLEHLHQEPGVGLGFATLGDR